MAAAMTSIVGVQLGLASSGGIVNGAARVSTTKRVSLGATAVPRHCCSEFHGSGVHASSSSVMFSLEISLGKGQAVGSKKRPARGFKRLTIRAETGEAGEAELVSPPSPSPPAPAPRKKSKVSVKPGRKQRVVLRFLWLEKNIGISLDQVVPGHGIIPLSPYFFWPRKDAWEELKAKLDSKKWISRKTTIILLNQATDIINLWQQNATNVL